MKFTYDNKTEDRECVAYIDDKGFIIKDKYGDCVYIDSSGVGTYSWSPEDATHKFYSGDSITITF